MPALNPAQRAGQVDQRDPVGVAERELGVERHGAAVVDHDQVRVVQARIRPGAEPRPLGQVGAEQVLELAEVIAH